MRLDKIKAILISKVPSMFALLMKCKLKLDEDISHAAMISRDGVIRFNPRFQYDTREWVTIMMHELMHRFLKHFERGRLMNVQYPLVWNLATDIAINFLLESWGFKMPQEWESWKQSWNLYEYRDLSAEQIYNRLFQDGRVKVVEVGVQCPNDPEQYRIDGHPEGGLDEDQKLDPVTDQMVAKAIQDIVQRMQGRTPGWMEVYIEKINRYRFPWHEKLRRYLTESAHSVGYSERTYYPPSERENPVDPDIILPRYTGKVLKPAIVIDVSASTIDIRKEFVMHTAQILEELTSGDEPVKVGFVDAGDVDWREVYPCQLYDELRRNPPTGNGGTVFYKAMEELDSMRPDVAIFFTDGYCDLPDEPPRCKLVWVIPDDCNTDMPYGDVIEIKLMER